MGDAHPTRKNKGLQLLNGSSRKIVLKIPPLER